MKLENQLVIFEDKHKKVEAQLKRGDNMADIKPNRIPV